MMTRESQAMENANEFPENFSLTAGERIAGDELISRDQSPPFYEGGQRRYAIDQAIHHLHFDTAAVLILGEEGSGKTALLDQLLTDLQDSMDGCLLDVENIGTAGLLPELAAGLDLHDVVEFTCETVADAAAQRSSELGLPLLVTLDNAEAMSAEQIDALFEVARLSHGSVRLLLCGDVALQVMADRAAQGEALFALQLPPLSRAEVGEYLQFLARRRGQLGRLALPAEALEKIYNSSHGNIGLINQQSLELFSLGSGITAFRWRDVTRMPLLHLSIVIGLVVFILILRLTGSDSSPAQDAAPALSIAPTMPSGATAAIANTESAMVTQELKLPESVAMPASRSESATAFDQANSSAAPIASTTSSSAQSTGDQVTFPSAVTTDSAAAKPAVAESAVEQSVVEQPKVEKPKPTIKSKTAAAQSTAKTSGGNGRGEKALLAMPSSAFVLQVFASHDKAKVGQFVKTYQSKLKISYFETRHDGKPWFVAVVAGPYKTGAKARAAIASLPSTIREQKPWPRQLSTIQKDIAR